MKWTAAKIRTLKGERKIAVLTAYDALTGSLVDGADIPMVLVGDSLGMTVLGYETTLPVGMDEMLHHTSAVSRGVKNALVVADMPFMSYQPSLAMGLENAGRFLKEAGADAVKIEGGSMRTELIEALVANGIPVLGHIGLTPQSIKEMGGYKVQGKTSEQARKLMDDAMAVEQAGAFALVLECIPPELGEMISSALKIPTIGIGAGAGCDGQVLVFTDLLGISGKPVPKFVKKYADLYPVVSAALSTYKSEVEAGSFPADGQTY
ncbi:MAG: 3-methyl-2-oxobutanoate hydroxymethyltransferase [Kiritimatiellales bacterium]|nr:3-methyl-2-oxobutanoate hydroxymethyltransferase [Kiritimatiellales bacterium]MCF7863159.1 3-methyl-2-oxobutanoate hydroxymethyltransferase [Kiritimatiellales bacterium]